VLIAAGCASLVIAGSEARGEAQTAPAISIAGHPAFATLEEATAAAVTGDTIMIGAGSLAPTGPVTVVSGVNIEGVSAGETLIDATALDVGILVTAPVDLTAGAATTTIRGLAIQGAGRGIEVEGALGVVIRNVILRDSQDSGLYVAEGAEVTLVNATLVRNGTAVAGLGVAQVRNSIIAAGVNGLAAAKVGAIVSSYNDIPEDTIFGNTGPAYFQVLRGIGDMSFEPKFVASDQNDWRLTDAQMVTDRGDPLDDFSAEPAPNGGRVNLGAFGGTAEAELSPVVPPGSGGGCAVVSRTPSRGGGSALTWFVMSALAGLALSTRTRAKAPKPYRTTLRGKP